MRQSYSVGGGSNAGFHCVVAAIINKAATWEVTLSARKVVPCVRWPATGVTAHSI